MNKWKKIGLTALAGSLVATSVSAADMSASGSWSWSWDSADSDESGNPMSMGDSVTFSASGETDQGWTATVSLELDGNVMDDQKLTLDMGDSGTIVYGGNSVAGSGIHKVKDIVPAADSAVYTETAAAAPTYGVSRGAGGSDNLGYTITVGDIEASVEAQKGAGTSTSLGVTYTGLMDGLTLAAGTADVNPATVAGGTDSDTMAVKYATGGVTVAYQYTDIDKSANDEQGTHWGISYAVNDDLTISYGKQEVEIQGKGADEINSGASISYTMGSTSIAAYAHKTEAAAGASGSNDEGKGITVSISF